MEYILQLEEKQRYRILGIGVALTFLLIMFSFMIMGIYGLVLSAGLLAITFITPLIYGKYKLFLFLWLLIIPCFDNFKPLLIGSTSLVTYLITALSIPFALILFYKELDKVLKELPFIIFIIIFEIIMAFNAFRPGVHPSDVVDVLKNFIEIFVIFLTFFYLKKESSEILFKWINIFFILNALTAIFQKLTGIGIALVEGVHRVQGLMAGANAFAFVVNIYLPLGFYMFINAKTKKQKIFWGIGVFVNFLALVITFAKTSYMLFGVMLLVLFMYLPFKIKKRMIFSAVGIVAITLMLDQLLNLNIIQQILNRFNNTSSWDWRIKVWGYLVHGLNHFNILIGNGINSSSRYLLSINSVDCPRAHNVYLQMLYEYGVLGVFFYIPFFVLAIKFLKASLSKHLPDKMIYIVPFIISIQIIIDMISSNSVLIRTPMYMAWALLTTFYLRLNSDLKSNSQNSTVKTV